MKKLFLASSFADSYTQLDSFLNESLSGKSVAFFDTASQVEEHADFKDEALTILKELNTVISIIDLNDSTFINEIKTADIIFVAGGNTFFLLQELRKSGADLLIKEHINSGKLYIGESAGSIILSPDIDYIKYMDEPEKATELLETSGLNIINVYPLPHVGNAYLDTAAQTILKKYEHTLPLYPLTDREVILIKE